MQERRHRLAATLAIAGLLGLAACTGRSEDADADTLDLLREVDAERSGVTFRNELTANGQQNIFNYMYFYNGAGVGVGDFDGDGFEDLYFASNQAGDQVFRNLGDLRFADVSDGSGVLADSAWSTGVSVVDIDGDGRLDVYVNVVPDVSPDAGVRNRLYLNESAGEGDIRFRESAAAYGLDLSGLATQTAWLDVDGDGDLDAFMLRHSVHQNGTFRPRDALVGKRHARAGDLLLIRDGDTFRDESDARGIKGWSLGYGLGVATADFNGDGAEDIYVANDFHEDDYLYLNDGTGHFTDRLREAMPHTSRFSMGVDVAELDGDGYPDALVLDMLPDDHQILKASAAEDPFNIWRMKQRQGYWPQYSRNVLQLSRGRSPADTTVPLFADGALAGGVAATDWSWSVLLEDFDLDGHRDAFISNGILGRSNDLDYINFVTTDENQERLRDQVVDEADLALADKMPVVRLRNRLYLGRGDGGFRQNSPHEIGTPSFSHGAAVADFDRDGDLDVVTNDVGSAARLYENLSADRGAPWIGFELVGDSANVRAVGANVRIAQGDSLLSVAHVQPVRGFLSSSSTAVVATVSDNSRAVAAEVAWPDGTIERFAGLTPGSYHRLRRGEGGPVDAQPTTYPAPRYATVLGKDLGLAYRHAENSFVEFNRQGLLPQAMSEEGPALAVADFNGDGRDDIWVGGGRGQASALYLQGVGGTFDSVATDAFASTADLETTDAVAADFDGDGDVDLLIGHGGAEYATDDPHHRLAFYKNDGSGQLSEDPTALPPGFALITSRLLSVDLDEDGDADVLAFPRTATDRYGAQVRGYALRNDGVGRLAEATAELAPWLTRGGMAVDAALTKAPSCPPRVVVAYDWGPVVAYRLDASGLAGSGDTLTAAGLWTSVTALPDGRLILGALGLNSKLAPRQGRRVRMRVADFDGNGTPEQLLTIVAEDGEERVFATRDELVKQMVSLRKRFPSYTGFSQATFDELFDAGQLERASVYEVAQSASVVADPVSGTCGWSLRELPYAAQLTTLEAAARIGDDVVLAGNRTAVNIQRGAYDAGYGFVLTAEGDVRTHPEHSGVYLPGQVRRLASLTLDGRAAVVAARNDGGLSVVVAER